MQAVTTLRAAELAVGLTIALAGALLLAGDVVAQDGRREPARGEPRNCVDLRSIDRTQVVDDDTILFRMRNGEVYRNDLPAACPALRTEETFMYRVTLSQLCSVDTITVLQNLGFGFMPTASCLLGNFRPISPSEADELASTAGESRSGRATR